MHHKAVAQQSDSETSEKPSSHCMLGGKVNAGYRDQRRWCRRRAWFSEKGYSSAVRILGFILILINDGRRHHISMRGACGTGDQFREGARVAIVGVTGRP